MGRDRSNKQQAQHTSQRPGRKGNQSGAQFKDRKEVRNMTIGDEPRIKINNRNRKKMKDTIKTEERRRKGEGKKIKKKEEWGGGGGWVRQEKGKKRTVVAWTGLETRL
ncbi:uncharacterized protein BO95DRAFT_123342 [Aspergillus brunneoviolaceus CBS 621.78]|uniref:Uncharacterized protein n=1 Tax=Aspergillus brunneoviolaceus CBS 621.78 TaxID=1450534 RepID=A0ACD1G9W5_9EURO|nr:hypothetical protein BO95DRAFT_123342 [Aspergillus brunneoviolaceus CBS 621.78]RAH46076.1 hypothetical protein BO95DRAFT_123342 [Aspergillus brunneoviolaceus CBS 621.78]